MVPAEEMSPALRRRVAALEGLHARYELMEEEHHERLKEIEVSYLKATRELFARRQAIVVGESEPTEEEVKASAYFEALQETEAQDNGAPDPSQDVVGVPAFWSTIMTHRSAMQIEHFQMSDADVSILEYLTDVHHDAWDDEESGITMEGFEASFSSLGDPGFKITFSFAPNPFLENDSLTLYCNGDMEVVEVDTPVWKDEKLDPTVAWVTKKVKKRGGGPVTKKAVAKPADSFFRIFELTSTDPDDDANLDWNDEAAVMAKLAEAAGGSMRDPGVLDANGERLEMLPLRMLQQEVLVRLRDDIIPRAQIYYIGALQGVDFDDDAYDDDWEEGPDPVRRSIGK